jgi:GntR family histidine utilization transcriptional repressor
VRGEVLRRIRAREWPPGELIPHEAALAAEFGCARATVNRALREVADSGLIERRRRAGTRVALTPVRKATLDIPVLRAEIEGRGETYAYQQLDRAEAPPPPQVQARLGTPPGANLLHLVGLHLANGRAHALEDRWIDTEALPAAAETDFGRISPNEWLVRNVPFEGGDIAFSAAPASAPEAEALGCAPGAPVFVTERTTWHGTRRLTTVRLLFAPGYRLHTQL